MEPLQALLFLIIKKAVAHGGKICDVTAHSCRLDDYISLQQLGVVRFPSMYAPHGWFSSQHVNGG
jgi:hypothetical protein